MIFSHSSMILPPKQYYKKAKKNKNQSGEVAITKVFTYGYIDKRRIKVQIKWGRYVILKSHRRISFSLEQLHKMFWYEEKPSIVLEGPSWMWLIFDGSIETQSVYLS